MADLQLTRKEQLGKARQGATDLAEALRFIRECIEHRGDPITHTYGLEFILDCMAERADRVIEQIELGEACHE